MLNKVEVTTNQGALLELPLGDSSEGYLVKEIEGLDPVKANLVSSSVANMDGEQYQSSRRETRNIVIKLGLEPDYNLLTARALRNNLYKFFMPKSTVGMRFYDDDFGFVDISGKVETFDCPLFTQEPEATISLLCYEPDFYDPTPVIFEGLTTSGTNEALIDYEGTSETGFVFNIVADQAAPEGLTIFHRGPDNAASTLEFTEPLSVGDTLDISTVSGAKGATLTNDISGTDSILKGITPQSAWINLFPGANYIRVFTGETGPAIPFTIAYTTKHGGL
jgi:hypothetical protein